MTSVTAAVTKITKHAILGQYPGMKGRNATTGVIAIRASVRMFGSVHCIELPECLQHLLADSLECVEDTFAIDSDRLEGRYPLDPRAVDLAHQVLAGAIGIG